MQTFVYRVRNVGVAGNPVMCRVEETPEEI